MTFQKMGLKLLRVLGVLNEEGIIVVRVVGGIVVIGVVGMLSFYSSCAYL